MLLAMLAGTRLRDNPFSRLQISYDLTDGSSIELGWVIYGAAEHPQFGGFDDRDRVLLGFRHYF